jgi:hypothetical protein
MLAISCRCVFRLQPSQSNCDVYRSMQVTSLPFYWFYFIALRAKSGKHRTYSILLSSDTIRAMLQTGTGSLRFAMQTMDNHVTKLLQFPSCCVFTLGLIMQLNFRRVGGDTIHLHYPVILLVLTAIMILNPVAIFCYRSRRRLLHRLVNIHCRPRYAYPLTPIKWRILFAGLYPIDWYDCYTGDMLCSLSYSMGVSGKNLKHVRN